MYWYPGALCTSGILSLSFVYLLYELLCIEFITNMLDPQGFVLLIEDVQGSFDSIEYQGTVFFDIKKNKKSTYMWINVQTLQYSHKFKKEMESNDEDSGESELGFIRYMSPMAPEPVVSGVFCVGDWKEGCSGFFHS